MAKKKLENMHAFISRTIGTKGGWRGKARKRKDSWKEGGEGGEGGGWGRR